MNTPKLPPLPFAVFDEFGQPCEDRVRDHFAAAIEALLAQIGQGVPVAWRCRVGEHPWWLEKEKPSQRLLMEIEPLYTHPAPQQKPLLDEKKIEMWTNATIECCTHMACYMRGIEDAEAAHNIGEKK